MNDELLTGKPKKEIIYPSKKKILIKYIIMFVILLLISIFTLVFINRINIFRAVFGSFSGVFEGVGVIIFGIALGIVFIYHLVVLIYIFFSYLEDKDWYIKIAKIDHKLDLVNFTLKAISILLFIMIFITTPCTVIGSSMSPTFETGQNIMCANYIFGSPKKNDIIVFDARNENHNIDDVFYIKRVVAVEGSLIYYNYDTRGLYIDNELVQTLNGFSQFVVMNNSIGLSDTDNSYYVPKGKLLVFGDNRDNSSDSRVFGYINSEQVFGRVFVRIFPFDKISFY